MNIIKNISNGNNNNNKNNSMEFLDNKKGNKNNLGQKNMDTPMIKYVVEKNNVLSKTVQTFYKKLGPVN